MTERVLVVDGGSCGVKIGIAGADVHAKPRTIPNCVWQSKDDRSRVLFGRAPEGESEEGEEGGGGCAGFLASSPTSSGCVVDWDIETAIWSAFLGGSTEESGRGVLPEHKKAKLSAPRPFEGMSLLCTEPALCPDTLRRAAYQAYFEGMRFSAVRVELAETLSLRNFFSKSPDARQLRHTAVVVDVGHSSTRVVPYVVGDSVLRPVTRGIRRIDVGGEVLAELYAQCTKIPGAGPARKRMEELGYVSLDCSGELARGESVENFRVPEALFTPSDFDINQCGIADATAQAIGVIKQFDARGTTVLVRGGSAQFKNLVERLSADLRPLLPEDFACTVSLSEE